MAKTFTISREKAVALLVQLGMSSKKAEKLDDAKLVGKLSSIDDTDEDANPGKHRKTFEKLVAANKKEYDIELEEAEEEAPPAKKGKAVKGKAAKEEKTSKASSNGKATKGKSAKGKTAKKGAVGRSAATIFGHSATSVAHWMGANGYDSAQALKVASKLMKGEVSDSTIRQAVTDGRGGTYGRSAELSKDEAAKIKSLCKGKA